MKNKLILFLFLLALFGAGIISLLPDIGVSQPPPPPGPGDGYLLKRSPEEMCQACHRTNFNTPAWSTESGFTESYDVTKWDNSIKTHSSDFLGTCSNSAYKNKRACEAAGATWTPGKWSTLSGGMSTIGWGIPSGKYGAFICRTCHTTHNTKNIYLIKETIRTPDGSNWHSINSQWVTVDFRYTQGTIGNSAYLMGWDSGGHTTSTRVCEVCHSITDYHRYDTTNQTYLGHYNGQNCTNCHSHKGGFAAGCTGCHGCPPTGDAHSAHIDICTNEYGNDSNDSTPSTYRLNCGNCHPLDSSYHNNGSKDVELYNASAIGFKANNPSNATRWGSGVNTVCGNVYCHSSGQVASVRTYKNTPQWNTTFAGNKCEGCHQDTPRYASSGAGTEGANTHYLGSGFAGDPTADGGHLVGIHFDRTTNPIPWTSTQHGDATYATTLSCNICHADTVGWATVNQYSTWTTAGKFSCSSACHTGSTTPPSNQTAVIMDKSRHVNAQREVAFSPIQFRSRAQLSELPNGWTRVNGYLGTFSYDITTQPLTTFRGRPISYNPNTKICYNVACHLDNRGVQWGNWGSDYNQTCERCHPMFGPPGCNTCHGNPPPTGAHLTHTDGASTSTYGVDSNDSTSGTYRFNCGNCHPLDEATYHINEIVEVELWNTSATGFKANNPSNATRWGSGVNTVCGNVYCHSSGQVASVRTYKNTPQWNTTFAGNKCEGCHQDPPRYANGGPGAANANSHYLGSGFAGDPTADGGHLVGIHFDRTTNPIPWTSTQHGDATYATTLSCNICHADTVGWATVNQYSTWTTAGKFSCSSACHTGSTTPPSNQTAVIMDKSRHVNAQREVAFSPIRFRSRAQLSELPNGWTRVNGYLGTFSYDMTSVAINSTFRGNWVTYNPTTKTCSNIACHLDNTSIQWGDWGTSQESTCNTKCHIIF